MLYQCPECSFTTEWKERDFADRGEPVCPEDDSDMRPAAELKAARAASKKRALACKHVWNKVADDADWCTKCDATRDSDGGIII